MIAKVYIFSFLLVGVFSLDPYRSRRDISGAISTNSDGSRNVHLKIPIAGNDVNQLSAIGSIAGEHGGRYSNAGGGLTFENINGHSLSVTGKHIPTFGDQLTAAAKLNLIHNDKHNLDANAFITKNMPKFPNVPDFNTKGGSLDYTYNNKVGASLGMTQTDFLHRNDYSAMGNVNIFRNPTSSLDLSAGLTKSVSPFLPRSSWQPAASIVFHKYW